jgi:hypothetical protein
VLLKWVEGSVTIVLDGVKFPCFAGCFENIYLSVNVKKETFRTFKETLN